ncbi:DUF1700 domain-containing protein [Fructobacillus sp. M1-13]|uniref:DUF1700 domain-containing protein n=1 Tax=Fructobacillus papyriferae TaxID=2713171 RepID=A0ABS5QN38_9LACO|nr:DUF1700 domain-containing protein [Fructobacillus papyriferae]MBS9334480.1 DUF1700 domain-containing protein [Fructobacillus papyriferae]MCD2158469.1 DUF1700 domain-containing protein [Fructobacillus papyriferae]
MTYLEKLEQALSGLSKQERQEKIDECRHYIETHQLDDAAAFQLLGTPTELAEKMRADVANKKELSEDDDEKKWLDPTAQKKTKTSKSWHDTLPFWLLVLGVPIWMPLLLALFLLLWIFSIVAWLMMFAFTLASAFVGIAGVVVLPQAFWGGLFYIGSAVSAIGLTVIFTPLAVFLSVKATDWTKRVGLSLLTAVRKVVLHE